MLKGDETGSYHQADFEMLEKYLGLPTLISETPCRSANTAFIVQAPLPSTSIKLAQVY